MMNHHLPAGPGHVAPAIPLPPNTRRQQEYHTFHHQQAPPQSPVHPHPYANYHHQPYYPHPAHPQYAHQRWQPHPNYQHPHQQYGPPQPAPYQPRSPMVVTSQPHGQPVTPVTRQTPNLPPYPVAQSPRPIPPRSMSSVPPTPQSPAPTPAKLPTPPPPPSRTQSVAQNPLSLPPEHRTPYYPDLPQYFMPSENATFPPRASRRRKRRQNLHESNDAVALPSRDAAEETVAPPDPQEDTSETSTIAAPSEPETPATSQAPSESDYTQVSTPATPAQAALSSPKATPTQVHARRDTRTAVPIIPAVPNVAAAPRKTSTSSPSAAAKSPPPLFNDAIPPNVEAPGADGAREGDAEETVAPETPPPKAAPKSWADLVRTKTNGASGAAALLNGGAHTNGTSLPRSASLADALKQYSVSNGSSVSFLEPRGLVNTGNMCYMNSVLQVLVFCVPFYQFLDQVAKRAAHSFKSDTPLVDALIMFMREFRVLESADSGQQLHMRLKNEVLEQYGEPVTPEYVYEVIRTLPRFSGMRRGHQQDAEEFLGFLLEGLHDECVSVMRGQTSAVEEMTYTVDSSPSITSPNSTDAGWLEVGPKQKASITRQAGQPDAPSPITKIFGGNLRSEFRVPGLKNSVTLEPYKPLQLDIGAQHVNNIIDAMKGMTRSESLVGNFGGRGTTGTKQVFIDTLPPVLILHLKRFQYDSSGGTQKIWKKVGYPLELEIPKEVFPPAKRGGLAVHGGAPRYRLISVVYHHGKSAAGGHYTVDVLRQDSHEWMRMDDTVIRRIRPEDVAEGGAEEDPKVLAKALEQHKNDQDLLKQRNVFEGLDEAEKEPEEEKPWSEVNGHALGHAKKWSTAAANTNGTATPSTAGKRTPTTRKEGVRDNKVAYILLYERM